MTDCIFCKIIAEEIPCFKIYENDKVLAFLDIMPVNKGHVLVIPKEHKETISDLSEDIFKEMMAITQKIAKAIIKGVNADGFNININNKEAAGQVIMHAHLHIVPRSKGDGLKLWPGGSYEEGEAEKVKQDIVKFL